MTPLSTMRAGPSSACALAPLPPSKKTLVKLKSQLKKHTGVFPTNYYLMAHLKIIKVNLSDRTAERTVESFEVSVLVYYVYGFVNIMAS